MKIFDSGNVSKKECCFVAFLISFLFVIILLRLYHYAPFGNKSLAWADGNIMYLDWFAYVKDVIHGDNSIKYTLSNALGGTYIAIFSTYISSPWNLLLALFEKTQQFYALDLKALDGVSRIIRAGEIYNLNYKDGNLRCVVNGSQNDRLFLSIPCHKGWHVTRNGQIIQPDFLESA